MKKIYHLLFCIMLPCLLSACSPASGISKEDSGPCPRRPGESVPVPENADKTRARDAVYPDCLFTFYCKCPINAAKEISSCKHYKGKGENPPWVFWTPVFHSREFRASLGEWRKQYRECRDSREILVECRKKMEERFASIENDLYNLVPAVREIAEMRPDFRFGSVAGGKKVRTVCGLKIRGNTAQPPEGIQGDIARIYFYMERAYPEIRIPEAERGMFQKWDQSDPVDSPECVRCKHIEKIQGNENSFVKNACKRAGWW
ncbi:MAG: endonuclease [Desulfococcaceae bacterium]|jgi:deoxyribonuclease-1|nr:endonuclease [Desulfococcaceae bacterium]